MIDKSIYEVWEGEELVSVGDADKVSNETGLSRDTIITYSCYKRGSDYKGWRVKRKESYVSQEKVNYTKLQKKMKEMDVKYVNVAEVLGIGQWTASLKVRGESRLKWDEIDLLEDLLFLDEGELICDFKK